MTGEIARPTELGTDSLFQAELSLLQNALFSASDETIVSSGSLGAFEGLDWAALYAEMQDQAVVALPADILPYDDMPPAVAQEWRRCGMRHLGRCLQILAEQDKLVRLLEDAGLRVAVLKGSAAACYYPCPQYRSMGDVDFIAVPAKDTDGADDSACDRGFEKACAVLDGAGYVRGGDCASHVHYRKDGVLFEPHRYFAVVPGSSSPEAKVDECIRLGMGSLREVGPFGFRTPALPDAENGLVLLEHMNLHLEQGLGLRHIVDWAMFVSTCCDDAFWESRFRALAAECGLETLARIATRACQLFLGLPEEGRLWCIGIDEELCELFMRDVLTSGNFGRKRNGELTIDAQAGYWSVRHPLRTLARAQRIGGSKLADAGCGKALRAFGWAYQLGYLAKSYAALDETGRGRVRDRIAGDEGAKRRDELLDALGVRRRDKGR